MSFWNIFYRTKKTASKNPQTNKKKIHPKKPSKPDKAQLDPLKTEIKKTNYKN